MKDAAEGERFEEAARYRNRLLRGAAPGRAAGGRQALRRHRRRDRDRCRRRSRRRPGLPAARRPADRPLRLPPRERRRAGHGDAARGVCDRVLRLGAERAAADRRAARTRATPRRWRSSSRERRGSRVEVRAPQRGEKRRLQELATRERAARARVGGGADRAQAAAAGRGARGAARGAEPREPAAADRVLRHLEHPGRVGGRLDGRLPGCDAEEGALPQVRRARASTARTTSRRWPR